jgi:hypothetical protein
MLARIDHIGKIQQLYNDRRPVAYLTFMHVFNELLADPAKVSPRYPTETLKETFRAACMAVSVGVTDTEGRAEQRMREFRQNVCPAWKAFLPADEFARYEQMLREQGEGAPGMAAKVPVVTAPTARTNALFQRLRIMDTGREEARAEAAAPAAVGQPRTFASVDEVCAQLLDGRLKAEYVPRGTKAEFGRYRLGDVSVAVTLADGDGRKYAVLMAEAGYASLPGAEERLDDATAEMGFVRQAPYAYLRQDDRFVCTLKVGPQKITVACSMDEPDVARCAAQTIQRAHMDLGELLERLRG